ncbi:MAG TPA: recombination mediator RecR [Candidatus Syntrophosphaera sp.]|mgnify:FL=1|jgi:recombination protein RecR|nr:recombination mediator RecR [Candidatus Cloacimonadota bacterium]HOR03164.1 recombination mediator RecR [Candidatus Syntrophosphaera sp.]HOU72528.1 recombination mediator RecR [Candidatus Syntrophosphaera sp.]HPB43186.1 recombination mediator RecR [Candidatus Syntrophosphaera sp.]HPK82603.1 recombination mediator RecR [Candidatus Syntrophosphaera sp.]
MLVSPALERLIQTLNRFPGIGRKTAQRLAWFLVSQNKDFALELAETITKTVETFTSCGLCNMLSESDPCPFCASAERSDALLCVVESTADIQIIENMNFYTGRYFVLGHLLSPIEGFGPEQIRSGHLLARIKALRPEELVLALKPSPEGEATIHYLSELLKDKGVQVTRLSTGIPFGGDLEYSSQLTLANAWKRRYPV